MKKDKDGEEGKGSVSDGIVSGLRGLLSELGKKLEEEKDTHGDVQLIGEWSYPLVVNSVKVADGLLTSKHKVGTLVRVRLVGTDVTYTGIYLGDLLRGTTLCFYPKSGQFRVIHSTNPAMFVPELDRVVWGDESWWHPMKPSDAEKEITDAQIQSTWYVQALKKLCEEEEPVDENRVTQRMIAEEDQKK